MSMTATILKFPRKSRIQQSTVISLYTDEEIIMTLAAINLHGLQPNRIYEHNLKDLDAESVEYCLKQASVNDLLSADTRRKILKILSGIEHLDIRQKM